MQNNSIICGHNDHPVILRKTSLIDYPGLLSAVIFFPGCNLRCPWCHNRELVLGDTRAVYKDYSPQNSGKAKAGYISLGDALACLEKRRKVLGGVVLSGGEPTLFSGLGELIAAVKSIGLKIKLDTNGLLPDVLETLFKTEETRPGYIAMDLKTSPERYRELLPKNENELCAELENKVNLKIIDPGEGIKRSAALIRSSGIPHEFRSLNLPPPPNTAQASFFGEKERAALAQLAGDSPWHIRPFAPGNCLDPEWNQAELTFPR